MGGKAAVFGKRGAITEGRSSITGGNWLCDKKPVSVVTALSLIIGAVSMVSRAYFLASSPSFVTD